MRGALKLRNCHRANVAEPDLWDLWALQLGPAAVHSLIIHSVKELGEYFKLGFEWIFLGIYGTLWTRVSKEKEHYIMS